MIQIIKTWIKKKLGILDLIGRIGMLEKVIDSQSNAIDEKLKELREYTCVDADIGIRGNNTIILTGVYKGKGYVRFYDVGDGMFADTVSRLQHMSRTAYIRNLDTPPDFEGYVGGFPFEYGPKFRIHGTKTGRIASKRGNGLGNDSLD